MERRQEISPEPAPSGWVCGWTGSRNGAALRSMPTVSFTTSGALQKSALRHANERLVLDAIRRSPGISRAEIARLTGFSRTSVTFVVNRLLKGRLVSEEKLENGSDRKSL